MAKYQKIKKEVVSFLNNVKAILSKGTNIYINNVPWRGNKVNTTIENYIHIWIKNKYY